MSALTSNDLTEMVTHWLNTPVYGYYGSEYGSDPKSLLQQPNTIGLADNFIAKMKRDIPILDGMGVGVYFLPIDADKSVLVISANERFIAAYPTIYQREAYMAYST